MGAERAETADAVVAAGAKTSDAAFTPTTDANVLAPTDAAPSNKPPTPGGSLKDDSFKSALAAWRANTRSGEVSNVPLVQ